MCQEFPSDSAREVPCVACVDLVETESVLELSDDGLHDLSSCPLPPGGPGNRSRGHVLSLRCLQLDVPLPQIPADIPLVTDHNACDSLHNVLQPRPVVDVRGGQATGGNHSSIIHQQSAGSKRCESLPGLKRYPGLKIKRFQHMLVAIDTSGSVSSQALSLFFAEIHGMWHQGAEVDIIECDAAVQRAYRDKGRLPKDVCGRGGTRFDPVFEWIKGQRRVRYDGCIYLTDGYAAAPEINPRCRVLWVVTADGSIGPHLRFGRAIQLPSP